MKIKKYRPAYFEGFTDEYYYVQSKEELLDSNLCKPWIECGYVISFSKSEIYEQGHIMAIKENKEDKKGEWWVVALIYNKKDIETLANWLPDFEQLKSNK